MAPGFLALVLIAVAGATLGLPVLAQKPSTPGARFNACTILTREEVKKIFPWNPERDREKETETPVTLGSICSYPGVDVYVGQ